MSITNVTFVTFMLFFPETCCYRKSRTRRVKKSTKMNERKGPKMKMSQGIINIWQLHAHMFGWREKYLMRKKRYGNRNHNNVILYFIDKMNGRRRLSNDIKLIKFSFNKVLNCHFYVCGAFLHQSTSIFLKKNNHPFFLYIDRSIRNSIHIIWQSSLFNCVEIMTTILRLRSLTMSFNIFVLQHFCPWLNLQVGKVFDFLIYLCFYGR